MTQAPKEAQLISCKRRGCRDSVQTEMGRVTSVLSLMSIRVDCVTWIGKRRQHGNIQALHALGRDAIRGGFVRLLNKEDEITEPADEYFGRGLFKEETPWNSRSGLTNQASVTRWNQSLPWSCIAEIGRRRYSTVAARATTDSPFVAWYKTDTGFVRPLKKKVCI